jgi:hypothetical protein
MPNWASSKVTIVGDYDTVMAIKDRLAKPYTTPWAGELDWKGNPTPAEQVEGVFLLWNIIKPSNLDRYLERDKKAFDSIVKAEPDLVELDKADKSDTFDANQALVQILQERKTSDDWYNWNCRNWGTKWEIGEKASIVYEMPTILAGEMGDTDPDTMPVSLEITYHLESAWSPPVEALDHLASQYPDITINLSSIDESDCFAYEAQWIDGNKFYENEPEITHALGMDLRGYCNLECCNE